MNPLGKKSSIHQHLQILSQDTQSLSSAVIHSFTLNIHLFIYYSQKGNVRHNNDRSNLLNILEITHPKECSHLYCFQLLFGKCAPSFLVFKFQVSEI